MPAQRRPARKRPAKKTARRSNDSSPATPWTVAGASPMVVREASQATRSLGDDLLLVCLGDPFDGPGDHTHTAVEPVPAADGHPDHFWELEATLEANPPRFFRGWATRAAFTLDLKVSALAKSGPWGGTCRTGTATGQCRLLIMRDGDKKVRFSVDQATRRAGQATMPRPETARFLNADVAVEKNGNSALSVAATAVISEEPWSLLVAGSNAPAVGLAFDGRWRRNLGDGDGASLAQGSFSFAVMTGQDHQALCAQMGWEAMVD